MEADPEFLALPARRQRGVDRAFDRGLRLAGGRPAKRRKLNTSTSASASASATATPGGYGEGGGFVDSGGFIDDGGGFIDDGGGGGFIDEGGGFIDDSGGGFIDEGGFIPETPSAPSTRPSTRAPTPSASDRIPLRVIPSLLGALRLPTDDDVLDVFRASASGWEEGGKGKGKEDAVSRRDFRAVCAALMEGEEEGDEEAETSDEEDEDAFEPSDEDEYEEDDDEDDEDYGQKTSGSKSTPKSASTRRRAKDQLREEPAPRLTGAQRELARELWTMLKGDATGVGAHLLGFAEVKRLVRDMGEMWSDAEITDMVALFSSQHEGRGLSFDDFGVVMMRAGLV